MSESQHKKQKTTRAVLSFFEKKNILDWMKEAEQKSGKPPTRSDVIEYIHLTYSIRVSRTFVTSLRKDTDKIMEAASSVFDSLKKRMQPGHVNDLEDQLREWFYKMEGAKAIMTDEVLVEKAKRIGRSLILPPNFKYSHTWLLKFKKSCGINYKKTFGEASAANQVGIETS